MDISILIAVAQELADTLPGARLMQVDEGETGEIYFTLKAAGEKKFLLINPRPQMPRIYLTEKKPPKSRNLSAFAQSLQNAFAGYTVESVTQSALERVISINFSGRRSSDEGAAVCDKTLIFELAGKKPNLIVVGGDGKVCLAQSCTTLEESDRPILPGLTYQPPPQPAKLDPYIVSRDDVALMLTGSGSQPPEKRLFAGIGGLSPSLAREIVLSSTGNDPDAIFESLTGLLCRLDAGEYAPGIYTTPKGSVVAALHMTEYAGKPHQEFASISRAAELFYERLSDEQAFASRKAAQVRLVKAKLDTAARKLSAIKADLAKAERADEFQLYAQLLMASPGVATKNADSVTLPNLFSAGEDIAIALDPMKNQMKNAEGYFKKAKKARSGAEILGKRLLDAQREFDRLAAELADASGITASDKATDAPGHHTRKESKKKQGSDAPEFPSFRSSDGYEVIYAKNAKMNDLLTFKLAQSMDMWLHAQGFHGCHVIVRNPERRPDIPLQTIIEAAEVAAYHSGAKKDASAPVDYTFKKYVRKPKDPKPGQALFMNNKTVFVEPRKR